MQMAQVTIVGRRGHSLGRPEIHVVHFKVPRLRRLAGFLRREKEIAVVAFLLILLTIYAFWA